MIMIVKTPGSYKEYPAVAEEKAEGRGGEQGCTQATTFSRASASSLSTSKPDEGRRAEGLEEALQYDTWLCVGWMCRFSREYFLECEPRRREREKFITRQPTTGGKE